MNVFQLFSIYGEFYKGQAPAREVQSLKLDSRAVFPGDVFIAVRGHKVDGHDFISMACEKGAIGLVVEDMSQIPSSYQGAVLPVKNTRDVIFSLAHFFYEKPSEKLICIGVTGTNGKTTTTYILEKIFNQFSLPMGVLGTIDHHFKDKVWESALTTPDAITLNRRLYEFLQLGARAVAFEVSSHALAQKRVNGIHFDTVVFTNLSRDHMDYHHTQEQYFNEKEKLFTEVLEASSKKLKHALVNVDDQYGQAISVSLQARRWTYGTTQSDFQFRVIEASLEGTHFQLKSLKGSSRFFLPLIGLHNVYNAVAAIATALLHGISEQTIQAGLSSLKVVPGRLERVSSITDRYVFVDYAHTSDALRTVGETLRRLKPSKKPVKLLTVFGCGGNRDQGKRPLMLEAALQFSDHVFLTSDNPREEPPESIIEQALEGFESLVGKKVTVQVDRQKAIEEALSFSQKGDIVLIAGKGHENYQEIKGKKIPFSDIKVAEDAYSHLF
ncbi:MAG: UDP-N-acetylmuramoyl-L-alanyl-D-glutamate--2,6-diaminopimelate ligase [Bdellovibrio sp.]|nr:MAG: UDP-N-acetylmuramoyl-L-alanyl-D-glutamate--2,6-diaminopimelate ligase [Bdellovibrio sp.]